MPGTYSQVFLHFVYATKHRRPWITPEVQPRLYEYIGGIVRGERGSQCAIGGIEDHVHQLIRWRTDESIANLMRAVKAKSSQWIHRTYSGLSEFAWQDGYSAFSVSNSVRDRVMTYIAGQRAHHAKEDFQTELLRLLRLHGVEFDEQHVFD